MTTTENAIRRPTGPAPTAEPDDEEPAFEGPPSTGESLLAFLKDGPRWHGDDLDECLAAVYASRSVWYP